MSAESLAPVAHEDKEAICKLMNEAIDALSRGDVAASLALPASDAMVLAPLRPAEAGSLAIKALLESLFKRHSVCETRTLEKVDAHGSWAFTKGSYRFGLIRKSLANT